MNHDNEYHQTINYGNQFPSDWYFNSDKDSDKFKKFINTKYSLNWNRRAYNIQVYFEQDTKNAGLNFTIFGSPFKGLGKEF